MPTYDYQCPEGHRFEVFQKMSDDPVSECPECGAEAKRLISGGAGFLFKGEGFYITDYRSDEYKKKASSEPGASAGAKGSSDGGSGGSEGGSGASDGGSGGGSKGDSGGSGGSSGSSGGASAGSSSSASDS